MTTVEERPNWLAALVTGAIAGLVRMIPATIRPYNFSGMSALCVVSGARLPAWAAFALPMSIMAVTDLAIWASMGWVPFNPFVYAAFALLVGLGILVRNRSSITVGATALVGEGLFFVITNIGSWVSNHGNMYERTAGGLWNAILAGVPFVGWNFASTLIFVPVMLGVYAVSAKRSEVVDSVRL